ncbi:hypothetical protein FA13DRAFT_1801504 [Coprinellus micaceus]|uniref:F-box domain-containing protein n=1 Tax=Coprinellus micaceus TaxID=71717 RepID=A0A4Y7SDX2_COPMI|nr:hypothetical protein FA13DRAFT_1801504 [Coprinellus micaceus]
MTLYAKFPLNEDIWSEIAIVNQPLSTLNLSSTCKSLRSCINTRSTWQRLLVRMCHTQGILLCTYPMGQMSIQDLTRAACCPGLWAQTAQRLLYGQMYPTFRGIVPKASSSWSIPRGFFERLSPGGRYLFQATGFHDTPTTLQLWDLGSPFQAPATMPPILVASKIVPQTRSSLAFAMCSTPDTIRVSLSWLVTSSQIKCIILSISPKDDTAFSQLAVTEFFYDAYLVNAHLTEDYLQIESDLPLMTTWCYKEGRTCSWTAQALDEEGTLVPLRGGIVVASHTHQKFYLYSFSSILKHSTPPSLDPTSPHPFFPDDNLDYPTSNDPSFNHRIQFTGMKIRVPLNPTSVNPVVVHARFGILPQSYYMDILPRGERSHLVLRPATTILDVVDYWTPQHSPLPTTTALRRRSYEGHDQAYDSLRWSSI